MKGNFIFLLVAALATLPFTLTSPTNLGLRQSTSLTSCLETSDCKAAASSWTDCQSATFSGLEFAPNSAQKNCLCYNGHGSTPFHPDWYDNLTACIKCVGSAGFDDSILNPLEAWEVNFCDTGLLAYNDFVVEVHNYNIEWNLKFPLDLPSCIYVPEQTSISVAPALPTKAAAVSPIVIGPEPPSSSQPSDTCQTSSATKTPANTLTHTSSYTSSRAAAVTAPTAPVAQGCNYDNCLRQAIQSQTAVIPFCKSYTTVAQTSTTGYPAYVSMCNNQPSSISSACTCLLPAQTPTQSSTAVQSQASTITTQAASQTHTSTNAGVAITSSHPSVHLTTVIITTYIQTTLTLGGDHSSTRTRTLDTSCTTTSSESSSTSKVSRSTSFYSTTTRTTLVTVTQSSSSAHSSTSIHTSSSLSTRSSTSSETPATSTVKSSTVAASVTSSSVPPAVPSSTTSSAAPASTTWVTLPPSDAMKACAASRDCINGASIYSQCVKEEVNGDQTASHACFCKSNFAAWNSSVINCAACVAKNLPPVKGSPSVDLIPALNAEISVFCNETDPAVLAKSVLGLDHGGLTVTDIFESPIDFFNLTLLSAPAPPFNPPTSSGTTSSSVTVVPASTSSSTTPTPTPTWITLPATDAMKQCQATTCQPAARVFNGCAFIQLNSTNEDPVFDCFCTTQMALWQSTLNDCGSCIAAALPANNPATGSYQAKSLAYNLENARQIFCNQTEAYMADYALRVLGGFGQLLTTVFQSPIEFFGMTLLTTPLAKRDINPIPELMLI